MQRVRSSNQTRLSPPLAAREQDALGAGFTGLRTNGNCAWVSRDQWDDFQEYEDLVHKAVRGRRMICMCSYSVDQFHHGEYQEVMARHDMVVQSALRSPARRSSASGTPVDMTGRASETHLRSGDDRFPHGDLALHAR
jgi:hypothetical protein